MTEYWRDLKLGEEIQTGDRCFGDDEEWFTINDLNLEYQRHVTECSRPIQRKSDCVRPIENGKNRHIAKAEQYCIPPGEDILKLSQRDFLLILTSREYNIKPAAELSADAAAEKLILALGITDLFSAAKNMGVIRENKEI